MKSARDTIIVTDATTGRIIDTINYNLYENTTDEMILKLWHLYMDNGIQIKFGISSY